MTTRIYFPSSGTASVSPAYAAGWGSTGSAARLPASRTRSGTAMATASAAETSASAIDVMIRQFVLAAGLSAQTITGTIKGAFLALESSSTADMRAQIVVKVVSSDGSTVRGTLIDFDAGALSSEFVTSPAAVRFFPRGGAVSVSAVTAQDGDLIVVEIGYRAHNTTASSRSGTITFGDDNANDLPESEAVLPERNPWLEFSQTLNFSGESVSGEALLDGGNGLSVSGLATAFGAAVLDGGNGLSAQGAMLSSVAAILDGGNGLSAVGAGQVLTSVILDGGNGSAVFGIQSRTGLSATAVASALAAETGEVWLILLTIDHATLADPIRVVGNHENITSRGDVYVGYPFSIDLPDDAPNEMPRVKMEIDNVGIPDEADPAARRVSDYIRAIDSPFTATIEVVLASQPDIVEAGPFTMTCAKAEYDAGTVSGDLIFEDVLNEPYPAGSFIPATHPGLF